MTTKNYVASWLTADMDDRACNRPRVTGRSFLLYHCNKVLSYFRKDTPSLHDYFNKK